MPWAPAKPPEVGGKAGACPESKRKPTCSCPEPQATQTHPDREERAGPSHSHTLSLLAAGTRTCSRGRGRTPGKRPPPSPVILFSVLLRDTQARPSPLWFLGLNHATLASLVSLLPRSRVAFLLPGLPNGLLSTLLNAAQALFLPKSFLHTSQN